MDGRVNSKQYLLSVTHWSRIQAAGVDYRRRRLIATEHNHQIAHHRRLALFVEVDNATLTQARASSTMPTAPSTMRERAATTALAC
jgi:hypothetical protein